MNLNPEGLIAAALQLQSEAGARVAHDADLLILQGLSRAAAFTEANKIEQQREAKKKADIETYIPAHLQEDSRNELRKFYKR